MVRGPLFPIVTGAHDPSHPTALAAEAEEAEADPAAVPARVPAEAEAPEVVTGGVTGGVGPDPPPDDPPPPPPPPAARAPISPTPIRIAGSRKPIPPPPLPARGTVIGPGDGRSSGCNACRPAAEISNGPDRRDTGPGYVDSEAGSIEGHRASTGGHVDRTDSGVALSLRTRSTQHDERRFVLVGRAHCRPQLRARRFEPLQAPQHPRRWCHVCPSSRPAFAPSPDRTAYRAYGRT
jgi:hypothetical protein